MAKIQDRSRNIRSMWKIIHQIIKLSERSSQILFSLLFSSTFWLFLFSFFGFFPSSYSSFQLLYATSYYFFSLFNSRTVWFALVIHSKSEIRLKSPNWSREELRSRRREVYIERYFNSFSCLFDEFLSSFSGVFSVLFSISRAGEFLIGRSKRGNGDRQTKHTKTLETSIQPEKFCLLCLPYLLLQAAENLFWSDRTRNKSKENWKCQQTETKMWNLWWF
jgi:hypothetical protein